VLEHRRDYLKSHTKRASEGVLYLLLKKVVAIAWDECVGRFIPIIEASCAGENKIGFLSSWRPAT
jgi:hypothetical protein